MGASGDGCHAEQHAIMRGNKQRLPGSTIYVAAQWRKHSKVVTAKPCEDCRNLLTAYRVIDIWYRNSNGIWCMDIERMAA
jgi:deoxycytidylate deaminase